MPFLATVDRNKGHDSIRIRAAAWTYTVHLSAAAQNVGRNRVGMLYGFNKHTWFNKSSSV
jgi:hypothetical protein